MSGRIGSSGPGSRDHGSVLAAHGHQECIRIKATAQPHDRLKLISMTLERHERGIHADPSAGAHGNAGGQGGTGTTARLAPASSIIYTAQLTVRAHDVSLAATQAAQIAEGAGGYVSSETAKVNPDHPSDATASVQLKIPVAAYPATLGQLGHRLGTQLSLQQQAQDVTQQVADVDSQVASDQAAIAQLRALLSHAGSVGELLSVQNQINSEEANLESMP